MINNSLIILNFKAQIDRDITVMVARFVLPCVNVHYLAIIMPYPVFCKDIKKQFKKIV